MFATIASAALTAHPQPQPFRAETELVTITATVVNALGAPVVDLPQSAFTIVDNDEPQQIALFAQDPATPVSVLVVVDVSGSMDVNFEGIRGGLDTFLGNLRDDDEVGLMVFDSRVRLVAPLGSSRAELRGALRDLQAGGSTALYDAIVQGLGVLERARHPKKVLLLLTDGNDTRGRVDRGDAVDAFERSDALVYGIGLGHGGEGSFLSLFDRGRMRVMRSFAGQSGGRAELVPNPGGRGNDLVSQMITAYGRELHQQYTIGYYPAFKKAARGKHEVKVSVDRPGMEVRARSVYRRPPRPGSK